MEDSFFITCSALTQVPLPIDVKGYEVALISFDLPLQLNVEPTSVELSELPKGKQTIRIPGGYFSTVGNYLAHINATLKSKVVRFSYHSRSQQVAIDFSNTTSRTTIKLGSYLCNILGLPACVVRNSLVGTGPVTFESGHYVITANIVAESLVHGTYARALHCCKADAPVPRIYVPLKTDVLDKINIAVWDRRLRPVKFASTEELKFVLHFRRKAA